MQGKTRPRAGLILTGGGARNAYQVGVLKAVAEILPAGAPNPFPIISGTSAGAINAAVLAIYAANFHEGVRRLVSVWEDFRVEQIFRADPIGVARSAAHWFAAMMFGGLGRFNPPALLDNSPLRDLLETVVPCEQIQASIDAGAVEAVAVTASGYASGESVSFFQSAPTLSSWRRTNRVGSAARLSVDHLMASAALPIIFPAVKVSREYFGDGSMRQSAPLSPALHLGAERLFVIGVRREQTAQIRRARLRTDYPSFGQIASYVLDTLFLDRLPADVERLRRINQTLSLIPEHQLEEGGAALRPVEVLSISPSRDVSEIAERHQRSFPRSVRFLLRGVGALNPGGRGLMSYVLFEAPYCRELIDLGYADTLARRDEVAAFLG